MPKNDTIHDIELTALMCSRVCHDVISPVGAIANGLEVLEDEDDEKMQQVALDLIRQSARQASAKLQFARLAFGAAGSAGAEIDMGDAERVVLGFVDAGKIVLNWQCPPETRPKNQVKLLLNMVLVGMSAIPRGGNMTVEADGGGLTVTCQGQGANVPEELRNMLAGNLGLEMVDARSVHLYLAGRLAVASGIALDAVADGDKVVLRAILQASAAA
jgi:histidine phosphotransferase ChpT